MSELKIKALNAVERCLVDRGIEIRGVTGRTWILPLVREALDEAPVSFEDAFRQTAAYDRASYRGIADAEIFTKDHDGKYVYSSTRDFLKMWQLAGGK